MEPIDHPIKIKIEGKKSEVHQIPVRIVESIDQILSFEQLDEVVTNKIATKFEFRSWKEIQKYFSL